jgi:hypothetical protein
MNENDNMSDKDKKEQGGDRNNNEGENMHSNTIYNIKAL